MTKITHRNRAETAEKQLNVIEINVGQLGQCVELGPRTTMTSDINVIAMK